MEEKIMSHLSTFVTKTAWAAAAVCAIWATGANAYSPKWLACDGSMTVTPVTQPAQSANQPASDTYVYDDDAHNLFKYSPTRKSLDFEGVTDYNDHVIKWAGKMSDIAHSEWAGELNRSTLALRMTYSDTDEKRVWTEQCKPTGALDDQGTRPQVSASSTP
jgi:hypothetical protein